MERPDDADALSRRRYDAEVVRLREELDLAKAAATSTPSATLSPTARPEPDPEAPRHRGRGRAQRQPLERNDRAKATCFSDRGFSADPAPVGNLSLLAG